MMNQAANRIEPVCPLFLIKFIGMNLEYDATGIFVTPPPSAANSPRHKTVSAQLLP
jgi:hypothetical protein